ncbi:MAG: 3'(2'),5'-bisphosphate nucleotidase CysQ [Actinomycetes bacterium]
MSSDVAVAARLATAAGELVLRIRRDADLGRLSPDPGAPERAARRQLRDLADRAAHDFLLAALTDERPSDAVLSEEGVDDSARLTADRLWIIDPVDGTWEFGQGRDDFAVHVALWERASQQLIAGALALPATGITYDSDNPVAVAGGLPTERSIRLVVSRSRPPQQLDRLVVGLGDLLPGQSVEVYSVGSAGAKTAEVIAGRADAYIHDAGLSEWDVAAPAAVAVAAGLHVSHLDGSAIRYNQPAPLVGDLLVATPALAAMVLALL